MFCSRSLRCAAIAIRIISVSGEKGQKEHAGFEIEYFGVARSSACLTNITYQIAGSRVCWCHQGNGGRLSKVSQGVQGVQGLARVSSATSDVVPPGRCEVRISVSVWSRDIISIMLIFRCPTGNCQLRPTHAHPRDSSTAFCGTAEQELPDRCRSE
jgi:hypothetical protein